MRRSVVDHLGREVEFAFPPQRIISLCPGITETLFALGLEDRIAGRTRYCIHPADKVHGAAVVGGTKGFKWEKIAPLQPDLVIAEKEENTKEMVQLLEGKNVPVFVAEVQSVDGAYRMVRDIGVLTGKEGEARQLSGKVQTAFRTLPFFGGKKAAYLIWKKPYMAAGGKTYINSLLERLGFANPFAGLGSRYPEVTVEDIQEAGLDVLLLATEPYPFKEEHLREFQRLPPGTEVLIADGEMFWYGPKMLEAADYFRQWPALLSRE